MTIRVRGYFDVTSLIGGGTKFMPVVDVAFGEPANRQSGRALIDTGAEYCIVDAKWAADYPVIHHLDSLSVANIGRQPVISGSMQIGTVRHSGDFCVADLAGSGHPFEAIIGMDFIQHFRLTVDVINDTVVLDLHDDA